MAIRRYEQDSEVRYDSGKTAQRIVSGKGSPVGSTSQDAQLNKYELYKAIATETEIRKANGIKPQDDPLVGRQSVSYQSTLGAKKGAGYGAALGAGLVAAGGFISVMTGTDIGNVITRSMTWLVGLVSSFAAVGATIGAAFGMKRGQKYKAGAHLEAEKLDAGANALEQEQLLNLENKSAAINSSPHIEKEDKRSMKAAEAALIGRQTNARGKFHADIIRKPEISSIPSNRNKDIFREGGNNFTFTPSGGRG